MKNVLAFACTLIVCLAAGAVLVAGSQQVRDSRRPPTPPPPPTTCSGASDCEPSPLICTDAPYWEKLPITLADGYGVTSDGRGPYVRGSNVKTAGAGVIGGFVFHPLTRQMKKPRAIVVDLSDPVPGGGGVPLGIITDDSDLALAVHWYTDSSLVRHNIHEIPVGVTVHSEQVSIGLHINGAYHWIQVGPQATGHCHAAGTAIHGTGTSRATIYRSSDSRWEIDLPPGSVGRLFDARYTDPLAIDRGLYYIDLRMIVGQ